MAVLLLLELLLVTLANVELLDELLDDTLAAVELELLLRLEWSILELLLLVKLAADVLLLELELLLLL